MLNHEHLHCLYLKDCGVTDAEIETFRAIMLR